MFHIRRRGRHALLIALLLLGFVAPRAGASRRDDERRELVERQRALLEELDTLDVSDHDLLEAITTLGIYVQLQEAEVATAQDELARLTVAAVEARRVEEAKQAEVQSLEEQMAEMAIAAYVAPPQADQMQTLLAAGAPADAASLGVYLDVQNRRDTDIVRQLREARAALGDQRERAEQAEARAQRATDAAVAHLEELQRAREENEFYRNIVQGRMGEARFESELISLELGRINQEMLDEARARLGSNRIVSVRGIQIHESLAGSLDALLAAAEADGILLGGGGYRDSLAQIELRRAHCGDDPYSIWEKPPGECSPPTAIPGTSLHELGLAVDFTFRGQTIANQSSPAFQWLAANAYRFGFYNLPSEPWHWSANGT